MLNRAHGRSKGVDIAGRKGSFGRMRWLRERTGSSPDVPVDERYLRSILDLRHLLAGEWVWDVLVTLYQGPQQYSNLLSAIQDRSAEDRWPGRTHHRLRDGMLNRTVRRLQQGELVERIREERFPYRTTYQLTPAARELLDSVVPLIGWVDAHADLVERVQRRRRQELSRSD